LCSEPPPNDAEGGEGPPPGELTDADFDSNWDEAIETFDAMEIPEELLRGIYSYGFEKPSAIQQRAIKPTMLGRDLIAQAQSGTVRFCPDACFCVPRDATTRKDEAHKYHLSSLKRVTLDVSESTIHYQTFSRDAQGIVNVSFVLHGLTKLLSCVHHSTGQDGHLRHWYLSQDRPEVARMSVSDPGSHS